MKIVDVLCTLIGFDDWVRYLRMKLENNNRERLSPGANLGYANVLPPKLNAKTSIDCWSAI